MCKEKVEQMSKVIYHYLRMGIAAGIGILGTTINHYLVLGIPGRHTASNTDCYITF